MLARIRDFARKNASRLTYLATAAALATLLEAGHATHWEFGLFSAARAAVGSQTPVASIIATPPDAEVVPLTDEIAAKSGIVVQPAEVRSMRQIISVNGVTAYDSDAVAQLSVRAPGHIWRVEKRAGQAVKKGDCLAIIDAAEVGEAKSALMQAVIDEGLKRKLHERLTKLAAEVAERSVQQAEADWREARVRLISSHQRLLNFGLFLPYESIADCDDEELAARVRLLGVPESIRSTLDAATVTSNLIPLTAPFDGVIVSRDATLGEVVTPEKAQFTVADISRMWILLDVRKEDAGEIRLGKQVEFVADGTSTTVAGQIDWINTELDPETRTLRVRAEVANPLAADSGANGTRLLKANTFGAGRIVLRHASDAVVVPSAAVQRNDEETFVFVRSGATFRRRKVQVGIVDLQFTEIVSGLEAGEPVAAHGSHVLKAELASN